MGNVIAALIARYGSPVTLRGETEVVECVALLQPVRHRGQDGVQWRWRTLGNLTPGQHILLCSQCPAGYDLAERDGVRYWIRRWEAYEVEGQTLYYWALLTKEDAYGTDL